tara:strand:- start:977 stop:1654 length:678 start_codon:yes stop_codon:yes gene_type:complete
MQNKNVSFIDNALDSISKGSSKNATIATRVMGGTHAKPANRIAELYTILKAERSANRIAAVQNGVAEITMEVKPEHLLPFIQYLMNQCCWSARRVVNSNPEEDFANGIDFSQPVAEQEANLESAQLKDVEVTINDDFSILLELHTWLASKMNYMTDIDSLYMFAQKTCVDEANNVWEFEHQCSEFAEVLSVLSEITLQLQDKADEEEAEFAATHEFGAFGKRDAA